MINLTNSSYHSNCHCSMNKILFYSSSSAILKYLHYLKMIKMNVSLFFIYFFLLRGCLWMNASEGNNHDDDNEHDSLDAKLNYYLWNICLSWFSSNCIFFNFPPRNKITIDWLKMKIYHTFFLLLNGCFT